MMLSLSRPLGKRVVFFLSVIVILFLQLSISIAQSADIIVGLDVSPIAPEYAIVRRDGTVEIVNYETNQLEQSFSIEVPFLDPATSAGDLDTLRIRQISYSPLGTMLAIRLSDAGYDGLVYVIDLESGEVRKGHNQDYIRAINDMSWSPDGTKLVLLLSYGLADQDISISIEILDVTTGEFETTILDNFSRRTPLAVAWNQSDIIAYSIGSDLFFWDVSLGQEMGDFTTDSPIRELVWSPDSQYIASISYDRVIRVWDLNSNMPLVSLPMNSERYSWWILRWMNATTLVGSVFTDVEIWDISTQEIIDVIETDEFVFGIGVISENEIIFTGPHEVTTFTLQRDDE